MKSIQLTIAEPCHENWNQMLPEEQGKFCLSCQKTVVDFSVMSDRQVLEYFKNDTGNTCGRFYEDQLGRQVSVTKEKRTNRWKYILQLLIPAVFAMHKAKAQGLVAYKPAPTKERFKAKPAVAAGFILKGKIIDEKGNGLPYATIKSADNMHAVTADALGNFTLKMKIMQGIKVSCVGYDEKGVSASEFLQMKTIQLSMEENSTLMAGLEISLQASKNTLDEVVVVAYVSTKRRGEVVGTLTTKISSGMLDSLLKMNKKSIKTKEASIKIYPNPIAVGQDFKVQFQVIKTGHFLLEIVDASGKLIQAQPVTISTLDQTETIAGYRLQQAGIYIVNLKNEKNKNIFTGKLLVQ